MKKNIINQTIKATAVLTICGMATLLASTTALADDDSPRGTWNGNRYQMVYRDKVSWEDAKEYCEQMGGHLVTITSQAEQNAVNTLLDMQTGFMGTAVWLGATYENGSWQWITGESMSYTNWGGQNDAYSCPYLCEDVYGKYEDVWFNEGGDMVYGYICEWEGENSQATQSTQNTQASVSCPAGTSQSAIDVTQDYMDHVEAGYVIPDVDSRYLSESELARFSGLFLMLARNEIYARRGYMFRDQNIQRYFNYQPWYLGDTPAAEFTDSVFNDYERKNIELIVAEEARRGGAVETIVWYN